MIKLDQDSSDEDIEAFDLNEMLQFYLLQHDLHTIGKQLISLQTVSKTEHCLNMWTRKEEYKASSVNIGA